MKIYHIIIDLYRIVGIVPPKSTQQYPFNRTNLLVLIVFSAIVISENVFFFCYAQNFQEYTDSFYVLFTVDTAWLNYAAIVWEMRNIFRFIKSLENTIGKSEKNHTKPTTHYEKKLLVKFEFFLFYQGWMNQWQSESTKKVIGRLRNGVKIYISLWWRCLFRVWYCRRWSSAISAILQLTRAETLGRCRIHCGRQCHLPNIKLLFRNQHFWSPFSGNLIFKDTIWLEESNWIFVRGHTPIDSNVLHHTHRHMSCSIRVRYVFDANHNESSSWRGFEHCQSHGETQPTPLWADERIAKMHRFPFDRETAEYSFWI